LANSPTVQELYKEYQELRIRIAYIAEEVTIFSKHLMRDDIVLERKKDLGVLVERFKLVVTQLTLNNVKLEDLLLVSLGVEVELFK
jgi:uncharacterized protein YaaN involved in tellurite resistance